MERVMAYAFRIDGSDLRYARGTRGPWDAIARSLSRRHAAPTVIWPICSCSGRAQWFDRAASVYREAIVRTAYCSDRCACAANA